MNFFKMASELICIQVAVGSYAITRLRYCWLLVNESLIALNMIVKFN